jgi:hypothetical protein
MSMSTYFRPNIHQNGPEILGVNKYYSTCATEWFDGLGFKHLMVDHLWFFKNPKSDANTNSIEGIWMHEKFFPNKNDICKLVLDNYFVKLM